MQGVDIAESRQCRGFSTLQGVNVAGVKADRCSMKYSLLNAELSTVRLHVIGGSTWQSTIALALAGSRHCKGVLDIARGRRCKGSSLQGVDVVAGFTMLQRVLVADCSLIHSVLNVKLSTVRLHVISSSTWQSTFALALAGSCRCRALSLQGVIVAGTRCSLLQGCSQRCRGSSFHGVQS